MCTVASRIWPRKSRKDATPFYEVSGAMLANWIGEPEFQPAFAIQEALRLGNNSPLLSHLSRFHKMVREEGQERQKANLSLFSKMHPRKLFFSLLIILDVDSAQVFIMELNYVQKS